ncbi:BZ3500_MvSof-1268-A1-R1_Chr2-3g05380 [Microbotryum saponariae]|uniref:BZ3500_MvSof-1268-A1-R1_Chr2-3g05380 protein n=1 Tax=Microbotryum saponariae TaxID=289078 RepID=A0A2X0K584_9BASI|nr:BZ3500_MvSof-1268-A1-R1_Chr2-3g05380 [Microbotryum saponariae]SDA01321.1 BZ3501_MvSof-1269-A2-R1_Chr2-2g05053 [Microbotryum saponariae]
MAPKQQAHVRQESDERGRMAVEALIVQMEEADEPMHGPFFDMSDYDPHLATPPDLLHILLLGMVKYLWVSTTTKRSADEKQELISWLATQSSCGLGEQIKGEFYVRASASCVGKDYRFIAQIFPLVAYFFQQRMWLSFNAVRGLPGTSKKGPCIGSLAFSVCMINASTAIRPLSKGARPLTFERGATFG